MLSRILSALLLSISVHLFAGDKNNLPELPTMNFELFQEFNDGSSLPSKFYKIHPTGKFRCGYGLMINRRMDGTFTDMPVYVEKNGMILSADRKVEMVFGMNGGYAEAFEFLLAVGKDENDITPVGKCVIVPFPLLIQDGNGRVIELQAYSPDGDNFAFVGSGFLPKEKIHFKSRSSNETLETDFEADSNGTFYAGFLPAVIGETEGPFEVIFSTPNMKPLKLRHLWGRIAFTNLIDYEKVLNEHPFPNE